MPSLDFVFDLTEKIKSQGISYLIITVQPSGDAHGPADTFYHIPGKKPLDTLQKMIDELQSKLSKARKDLEQ